jgi:hypothetical protein
VIVPNLFSAGTGRSGTSALHEYLDQSDEIFMSCLNEPNVFSHDDHYAQGLEPCAARFDQAGSFPVRGESSTS